MTDESEKKEEQKTNVQDSVIAAKRTEQWKFYKSIAKIFGLSLFVLMSVFCCVMLSLPVLAPAKAISLYESLGMNKAILATRQMQYERTGNISDLYNLAVEAEKQENWQVAKDAANAILQRQDFDAFATKYQTYAIANSKTENYYIVASLENQMKSLVVKAEYHLDREKALEISVKSFGENRIDLFYFAEYINCVMSDKNLTENKKMALVKVAAEKEVDGKTVLTLTEERYLGLHAQAILFYSSLEDADLLLLERLWETKNIELSLDYSVLNEKYSSGTTQNELVELARIIASKTA